MVRPIGTDGVTGKVVTGTAVLLATLSNPEASCFLTSMHVGTLVPRPGPGDIVIAALAFAGLGLPCLMLGSPGGAQLRRVIRTPAAGRMTAIALGCTILASVSMLFLSPVS
ncbi:hypothetical protein [Rhodovulum sp. 12E13]|uniref:hypothetical protein n=1 Tax=Rhodovulum sp. 12E13 TaxID=2203891 RepID=UPI001F3C955C|nr:hypothetical protein [Rhodovulum sp. 12E13]